MSFGSNLPILSISIPTWNRRDLVLACLGSIFSCGDPVDLEVIVVDNGSSDGTADRVAAEFPQVRLIRNGENLGFAKANNQAFSIARGRYFLLLNSDTQILPGAFSTLVSYLENHPKTGAVGPQLLNPDGSVQPSRYVRFPSLLTSLLTNSFLSLVLDQLFPSRDYPGRFLAPSQPIPEQPREYPHLIGACLLFRSDLYQSLGMLDERFFIFREETDLCRRIRDAGWTIAYVPRAQMTHLGASGKASWGKHQRRRIFLGVESDWLYHCKYRGMFAGGLFILLNGTVVGCAEGILAVFYVFFYWNVEKRRFLGALLSGHAAAMRAYARLAFGLSLR